MAGSVAHPETALDERDPRWRRYALTALFGLGGLYWALMAQGFAPLHFDEAQYWSYGEALDWGYYSKPPLVAWLIRASTELFGDTAIGVRAFAPVLHVWIGWMIYLSAARLFEPRTGFWAALTYIAMPGVVISSGLMTTDPPMMAAWATALYALIRAIERDEAPLAETWGWWLLLGGAIGVGLLGKYTMIAFVGGALGYALLSRQGGWGARRTDLRGPLLAALAALAAFAPNLWWNAENGFASFVHVADNARLGGGSRLNPENAAEFFLAQAAVAGPVVFAALLLMLFRRDWRHEWSYRLLLWLAAPLPLLMTVQALLSRAHPNWAAPAYVAAAIAAAAWLLDRDRAGLLRLSAAIGLLALVGFGALAFVYDGSHAERARLFDPYKKMRPGPAFCAIALERIGAGASVIVSPDRRLLADCMFAGGLTLDRIRVWTPGAPGNHYQLVAPLRVGEPGEMLYVALSDRSAAARFLDRFDSVRDVEEGELRTHRDRVTPYVTAWVSGFRGY